MRLLLALALFAVLAAPARAQSLDEVAAKLKTDHVVVEDGSVDADALKAKIGSDPTFIAVLPPSAIEGSAGRTLIALRQAVGVSGSYALVAGDEFRTLSDEFDNAAQVGDTLKAQHPDDLQATLEAYVGRAAVERNNGGGGAAVGAVVGALFLLALLVGGVLLVAGRRRTRKGDGRSTVGQIDQTDDFVRLGDQIRALELDVTLGESGRADYDRAVAAYDRANDRSRHGDEAGANRALDEGLAAIATARERIAGR